MYTEYEDGDYGYNAYQQRRVVRKPVPKVKKIRKPLTDKQKIIYVVIGIIIVALLSIGTKEVVEYYDSYEYNG